MKRVFILIALVFASCQKEEIVKTSNDITGNWTLEVQQEWKGSELIEITEPNEPITFTENEVTIKGQTGYYLFNGTNLNLDMDKSKVYELGCCVYDLTEEGVRIKVPNGDTTLTWFLKR